MEVDQGKMEEDSESGKHPLEIPEMLVNILECLSLEDLKSSRLVCKRWRNCGIAPMKKKKKGRVMLGIVNKTINDLVEFVQCLNSVAVDGAGRKADFPCTKVCVNASLIRLNKKERHKDEVLFANVLEKINPWVTELVLRIDLQQKITANAFPLSLHFPKLQVLELLPYGSKIYLSKKSAGNFYRFATSILERARSLRTVEFIDDGHSFAVDAIIRAGNFPFTEMIINGPISNSSLEKLSKCDQQMKLKSLDIIFGNSKVNSTSLSQLLRSQNDSLEALDFHVSGISSPILVSFPEMPKLKSLTIKVFGNDNDDGAYQNADKLVKFSEISYERQFPALKTLHLKPWDCKAYSLCNQFIKLEMSPVETIEELTLPTSYVDEWSLITAQNAIRIFPNVKKLEIAADPAMLPTIFQHWTNLEQLTLNSNGVCSTINCVLMGQTPSEFKKLQKRIKRAGENFDWNQLQPGNPQESIVNLQNLRVLRFKNADNSRELEVGRESLQLIFSRILSLRRVDFGNRCFPMETKIDRAWWAELNEGCVVLWNHVKINRVNKISRH